MAWLGTVLGQVWSNLCFRGGLALFLRHSPSGLSFGCPDDHQGLGTLAAQNLKAFSPCRSPVGHLADGFSGAVCLEHVFHIFRGFFGVAVSPPELFPTTPPSSECLHTSVRLGFLLQQSTVCLQAECWGGNMAHLTCALPFREESSLVWAVFENNCFTHSIQFSCCFYKSCWVKQLLHHGWKWKSYSFHFFKENLTTILFWNNCIFTEKL